VAPDQVPQWLNASDVLLMTSLHEGSPTIVKEALACGLPTVSVDVGDVGEQIKGVVRDETGEVKERIESLQQISGMAPRCKLLSLKVLDDKGEGQASSLIAAIGVVQEINGNGRYIRVHGVNMSVGYDFEPEWFACGQSPLCVEVDRLVKSGVVVVGGR
jgi:hypothetical protein